MSHRPRFLGAGLIAALALVPDTGPALPAFPGRAIDITFAPEKIAPAIVRARTLAAPAVAWLGAHFAIAIAGGALLFALFVLVLALARTPARRVRALAARGLSPAAIARRTGLAQDHVRALVTRSASGAIDRQALPSGRKLRVPRFLSAGAGAA